MLKIKLADADELDSIVLELSLLTYLQELVLEDINEGTVCERRLGYSQRSASIYLFERQLEVVLRFKRLLCREDFLLKDK